MPDPASKAPDDRASVRGGWAAAGACAAAWILLFQFLGNATRGYIATNSLFYWWTYQWVNRDSETQHAWLILGLGLFLLWRNLRKGGAAGPAAGAAAASILGGLALHAVGFVAQQPRVSILGLLACVWGTLALGGGRRWGGAAAFPVAFMVFAIPLNALDTVGFWLQMWVVHAGAGIAHALGIAVIRNGTRLFSPDGRYQYDVVAACSGIRSLMALTALSLFVGYLWLKPAWLRGAMLLASLPLVYLGNVFRITSIVIAAQAGGQRVGDRVHDIMGIGVFAIVVGAVMGLAELAARRFPAWAETPDGPPAADGRPLSVRSPSRRAMVAALVFAACGCEAAFLSYRAAHTEEERPGVLLAADGRDPVELPTYLGSSWMGRGVAPEAIERQILPPDTGYSRKRYVNLDDPRQEVLLSVVLSGRDRTSIHRPELCVVGQGFTIERSFVHGFAYPGKGSAGFEGTVLDVRREVQAGRARRSEHDIIAYWFVGNGRVVASQGLRIAYDAWNRLASGRASRWAYVYAQTSAEDGTDTALARIQQILDAALPRFQPPALAGDAGAHGRG